MRLPPKTSLQSKLISSLLIVVIITGIGSMSVAWSIIDRNIIDQAYETVAKTLELYGDIYSNKLYVKHRLINSVSSYSVLQKDVENANRKSIYQVMKELLKETHFDILNVTDASGRILVRSNNYDEFGDYVSNDKYVTTVIKTRKTSIGFDVMERDALLKEGSIADRVVINVVPTDRARRTDRKIETRGMFLKAASPIIHNEKLVGVIYGALLLNHDIEMPDRAKSLVFGDEQLDGRDIGTATLFLDDLRISTTVRNKDGQRAIGTMVSEEVFNKVYEEGKVWKDKAFVVDDWYIAAYKPVRDIEGKTIGIIYTGILEEKYNMIKQSAMVKFLIVLHVTAIIAIVLAFYIVHLFIRPIRALVDASKEIIKGNYIKVDIQSDDEMGYLGYVYNNMVDSLIEKDRKLMEHVEKQILQSEKLASLGRLASGIAHEINNPLTGVLTYSCTLMEDLKGTEYEDDLRVIRGETLRCREIVKGILDFARETKPEMVRANLNQVIKDVLVILEKHVAFQNIKIIREFAPELPDCFIDVNQIKSVINNLCQNSADAMPHGGTLTINTRMSRDSRFAVMRIIDTGTGISEENLSKVFDPFFTTKETGKGTGLGLSVTYGIVKRHKGFIKITSKIGEGTTVEVQIPVNQQEEVK